MKTQAIFSLLILSTTSVAAQDLADFGGMPTSSAIGESKAGLAPNNAAKPTPQAVFYWKEGKPNCSTIYRDGLAYKTVLVYGVLVGCGLCQTGKYRTVKVFIANGSKQAINVMPSCFQMGPDGEQRSPIEPDGLSDSTATAKTAAFLAHGSYTPDQGYTAPVRTVSSVSGTVNGSSIGGTGVSTSYSSGHRLRDLVAGQLARQADSSRAAKAAMTAHALKANTLMPGQQIAGDLHFKKVKGPDADLLKETSNGVTVYF